MVIGTFQIPLKW